MRRLGIHTGIVLAAGLLVSGCGDGGTGPVATSRLSFDYSGSAVGSGSVAVEGRYTGGPLAGTYATGQIFPVEGVTAVFAARSRSATALDAIFILVDGVTEGTHTCLPEQTDCSSRVEVAFNANPEQNLTGGFICRLDTNTVTITAIQGGRIQGSFSGDGVCEDDAGNVVSTAVITNGSFDVEASGLPQ